MTADLNDALQSADETQELQRMIRGLTAVVTDIDTRGDSVNLLALCRCLCKQQLKLAQALVRMTAKSSAKGYTPEGLEALASLMGMGGKP